MSIYALFSIFDEIDESSPKISAVVAEFVGS